MRDIFFIQVWQPYYVCRMRRDSWVRVPVGAGNFSLGHSAQTGSQAHPSSYTMGSGGSFLGDEASGAWSWPLTSVWCRGQEYVELHLYTPNTSSWRGTQLKHRDNFTLSLMQQWLHIAMDVRYIRGFISTNYINPSHTSIFLTLTI
jgi:hypothetical protein